MNRRLLNGLTLFVLLLGAIPAGLLSGAQRPQIEPTALAESIHAAVNRQRQDHGLPALQWDPALAEIAAAHSRDMAEHGYVGHVNPAGENPSDRGRNAGYICRKPVDGFVEEGLAENLCRNSLFHATRYTVFGDREAEVEERLWNTPEEIVDSTVRSWMESPGHRENILYPHHGREGIGVTVDEDGRVYVTQLFC